MPDLRDTRRKLTIAFSVLGVIAVLAIAVLLSPLAGSRLARREQLGQLEKDLLLKTRQVQPLVGFDGKIKSAHQQVDVFYRDRLPSRYSAISESLGRVATQTGVKIGHFGYSVKDPEGIGLRPVLIDASLSGNYLQLIRFINSLERDQLFFIVDSVQLGGAQNGEVRLQMKFETYLNEGS